MIKYFVLTQIDQTKIKTKAKERSINENRFS